MIRIGIVGTGMRGGAFKTGVDSTQEARITAVCDVSPAAVHKYAEEWNVRGYTNYEEMLDDARLDAVIIATPVSIHVDQAIAALRRGVHVYSEIPAAATLEQCRRLVEAVKQSSASYVLGENMVYMKEFMTVENMIAAGLFGEIYYMLGEYLHNIKDFFALSPWRKTLMAYQNGVTYGTHSLGPMLIWMPGDRVNRVLCTGSGRHYIDEATGKPFLQEDGCLMLCKTEQGRAVDIRVELLSTRPYALNYRMQGTAGSYENLHEWTKGLSRVWCEGFRRDGDQDTWMDFDALAKEFVPAIWREVPKSIMETTTHWGIDYVTMREWIAHLCGERPFRVDIHRAMDLTLPGIMSTESIDGGSAWVDVPNSRDW